MARPDRSTLDRPDSGQLGIAGQLRRLVVSKASIAFWRLLGVEDDEGNVEEFNAEAFAWPGLAALPKAGARVEAIVVAAGGNTNTRYIVAARDQDLAKALALALDETALHNSLSRVHVKADGTIEARTHAGAAVPLATKADVQVLRDYIATSLTLPVIGGGGGTAGPNASPAPPQPAGTTKLKGE